MSESVQTETHLPTSNLQLKDIIEESKIKLHEASPIEPKSVPRRRGNPGGPRGPYKKTISAALPDATHSPATPPTAPRGTPPPDIKNFLIAPIQMISKIPAQKHGIAELAFDKEESEALADSIDGLVKAFIPDLETMSPKTAAVFNFSLISSTIFVTKYQIFNQKMLETKASNETESKEQPTPQPTKQDFDNGFRVNAKSEFPTKSV